MSENLHTFVRALGHQIRPEQDRDSKLLARLRVCPAKTVSYKRTEVGVTVIDFDPKTRMKA